MLFFIDWSETLIVNLGIVLGEHEIKSVNELLNSQSVCLWHDSCLTFFIQTSERQKLSWVYTHRLAEKHTDSTITHTYTRIPNMENYPQSVKHSLFDKQFVNQLNVCLQADHVLFLLWASFKKVELVIKCWHEAGLLSDMNAMNWW